MADVNHIIEPERFGIWIAVTFVIALLALVLSSITMKQNYELAALTQIEVLALNKKIEATQPAAPTAAPAEPAATAE